MKRLHPQTEPDALRKPTHLLRETHILPTHTPSPTHPGDPHWTRFHFQGACELRSGQRPQTDCRAMFGIIKKPCDGVNGYPLLHLMANTGVGCVGGSKLVNMIVFQLRTAKSVPCVCVQSTLTVSLHFTTRIIGLQQQQSKGNKPGPLRATPVA